MSSASLATGGVILRVEGLKVVAAEPETAKHKDAWTVLLADYRRYFDGLKEAVGRGDALEIERLLRSLPELIKHEEALTLAVEQLMLTYTIADAEVGYERKTAQQPGTTNSQLERPVPNQSTSGIPVDPAAKYGGILVTGYYQEGPTFSDWEEAAGIPPYVSHKMLNMLVRNQTWGTEEDFKHNAFFKLQPDLAKSWRQSADGLKWTFDLRDGVKWSDGKPFTCADAKWSFDTIRTGQGLKRSPRAVQFLVVKDVQCVDDLTLVFNMKYPKPGFLEVIGMPYHVIRPKHRYENATNDLRIKPPEVTTGPFVLKSWLPGEKYVWTRNLAYWDSPLPYLDGIEMPIIARASIPTVLRTGRIDIGDPYGFSGGQAENLLKECQVCTFWPRVIGSSQSPSIMLNHQRAPWNTKEVKDAVALAFDNNKYVQAVQQGWYVPPIGGGFYPTSQWAMPAERVKAIPGYGDFFPDGNPATDKEKAKELLTKAGYKPMDLKVKVVFWKVIEADAPAIIEDLRAIGIDAEPLIQDTAQVYNTWMAGDFDIGVHSFWVAGIDPDVILYEHFYTGSDRNYNRYSNPAYDNLVNEMSRTVDPEARKQKAWDAMEIALRGHAKIIMGHSTSLPIHNKRLKGMMPGPNYLAGYGPYNRYDTAWLAVN